LDRARDLRTSGKLDEAIAEYGRVLEMAPSVAVRIERGSAEYDKGDLDAAIADFEQAVSLDPKSPMIHTNRGNAYAAKGEFDKALADYAEAIRLDRGYVPAYKNRAWIWATCSAESVRDGKRAVESATRACELTDRKGPSALDVLAAAQAEAGDFEAAAATQARAIALTKDFETRRQAYATRRKVRESGPLAARLVRAGEPGRSKEKGPVLFTVPYDAVLFVTAAGGQAGAVSEFGLGTSEAHHTALLKGLPSQPEPDRTANAGFVAKGTELHFYVKTEWGGKDHRAFSDDRESEPGRYAFGDPDDSLGMNGSILEKTGPKTWLLHMDDEASYTLRSDNDEDILVEIRLEPAARPGANRQSGEKNPGAK
jgi:Tfp pilus assembly protein PilF